MGLIDRVTADAASLKGALRALRMTTHIAKNPTRTFPLVIEELADRYGVSRSTITRAMRVRPSATYVLPYHAVRVRLQLATVYLALAEPGTVRQLLREIDDVVSRRPALGTLIDEIGDFRAVLASAKAAAGAAAMLPLTPAELRLLPYLQTHLTAEKIAERLFISVHTVKTEVRAIYRKLGVSSRNEAVQKATAVGLLGG